MNTDGLTLRYLIHQLERNKIGYVIAWIMPAKLIVVRKIADDNTVKIKTLLPHEELKGDAITWVEHHGTYSGETKS